VDKQIKKLEIFCLVTKSNIIMDNEKIVILGGSGSIGSEIASEVKDNGYMPYIIGRNVSNLKVISEKLKCPYRSIDVLNTNALKSCLEEIEGNIIGLAYCVGSIGIKSISSSEENDYIESYKLNTLGAIHSIKSLLPSLKKNNGSILMFSSIAVQQGFANHTIISSSKGAIEALTRSLAAELSPQIRVNCIAPSLTDSKMSKKIVSNENIRKAIESMHPIPKLGAASDYSKLAAFLLGKNNKWITGQVIHVDGGRSTLRKKG